MRSRAFLTSLYGQVLIATIAGVVFGYVDGEAGAALRPLADGFIKLVRMVAGPIIFCTVVAGIAAVTFLAIKYYRKCLRYSETDCYYNSDTGIRECTCEEYEQRN